MSLLIPRSPTLTALTRTHVLTRQLQGAVKLRTYDANLDLVSAASPRLHERFRREVGRAEDDPSDRLADLSQQIEWLRALGFDEVDCHFKWLQLALIVARRSRS